MALFEFVSCEELLALVDERRSAVYAFIDWAEDREASGSSMYLAERPDIAEARRAAALFPDKWWGVVVFTCFGTRNNMDDVQAKLPRPVDPLAAQQLLDSIEFKPPKVGHHRVQATGLRGAKTALVQACKKTSTAYGDLLYNVLERPGSFDSRYRLLRAAKLEQWGRTTCFDLFVRAGALGIGGPKYEPLIAYLDESTGPMAGFHEVWGKDVTKENAPWCEGLLKAWHDHWDRVVARVSEKPGYTQPTCSAGAKLPC